MSRQSEFLSEFLKSEGISRAELSRRVELSASMISNVLTGRMGISKKLASKLNAMFGISSNFLLYGEGEPMNGEAPAPIDAELYKINVSGRFSTTVKVRATSVEGAKTTALNRIAAGEFQEESIRIDRESLEATE